MSRKTIGTLNPRQNYQQNDIIINVIITTCYNCAQRLISVRRYAKLNDLRSNYIFRTMASLTGNSNVEISSKIR